MSGSEAGDVLIAGGLGINSVLASSELFVPGMTTMSSTASIATAPDLPPVVKQQEIAQTLDALRHQFEATGRFGGRL